MFSTAVARGTGYVIDERQLLAEIKAALVNMQPQGYSLIDSSVRLTDMESFTGDGNSILRLTVSGQSQAVIRPEELVTYFLGTAVEHLDEIVEDIPVIARLDVQDYSGDYLPKRSRWLNIEVNSIGQ